MPLLPGAPRYTSLTSPLRLDRIPVAGRSGTLSLTLCPGKHDPVWDRDLRTDLLALRAANVTQLVYLLEEWELEHLGIGNYAIAVRAAGIIPHHLPIPDGGTVGSDFDAMLDIVDRIRLHLSIGEHVVVHCRGGLGRAGTVAASVLTADGMPPAEAIAFVRRHRAGAIENPNQETFIHDFSDWLDRNGLRSL